MEASADARILVRKITDVHANWSAHGENEPGVFSYQLILDDGAVEYVVLPSPQAAKVFLKLIKTADAAYIDTERGAVSFGRLGD
jgi:hypothetical protein